MVTVKYKEAALKNLGIDEKVAKMIEDNRRKPDDDINSILRRVLLATKRNKAAAAKARAETKVITYKSWEGDGVVIPHGTRARMVYQNGAQTHYGEFVDGLLVVDGTGYETLSTAANAVAVTRSGRHTRLNGWRYWDVMLPGSRSWVGIDSLRNAARKMFK